MLEYKSELLFWLGIMRDHAMFQFNALAPTERSYIEKSMYYREYFQKMIIEIENAPDYKPLLADLLQELQKFISYKQMILKSLLTCQVQMNLVPGLINHQITEASEFKTLLLAPQKCLCHMMNLAGYIKIWLADSVGHAAAIVSFLDPSEALLIEDALNFKMTFANLQIKASELEVMMNNTGSRENELKLLANETIFWMNKFIEYNDRLKTLRMNCEAMGIGTFSPLVLDHFNREHTYFIAKINDCMNV